MNITKLLNIPVWILIIGIYFAATIPLMFALTFIMSVFLLGKFVGTEVLPRYMNFTKKLFEVGLENINPSEKELNKIKQ